MSDPTKPPRASLSEFARRADEYVAALKAAQSQPADDEDEFAVTPLWKAYGALGEADIEGVNDDKGVVVVRNGFAYVLDPILGTLVYRSVLIYDNPVTPRETNQ